MGRNKTEINRKKRERRKKAKGTMDISPSLSILEAKGTMDISLSILKAKKKPFYQIFSK
jgi:hypothetical protein